MLVTRNENAMAEVLGTLRSSCNIVWSLWNPTVGHFSQVRGQNRNLHGRINRKAPELFLVDLSCFLLFVPFAVGRGCGGGGRGSNKQKPRPRIKNDYTFHKKWYFSCTKCVSTKKRILSNKKNKKKQKGACEVRTGLKKQKNEKKLICTPQTDFTPTKKRKHLRRTHWPNEKKW